MANYTNLKNIINQYITTNGQGDITGAILNDVLKNIVDSIGTDFLFAGVAEPTTNPGSPDQNVFYIAAQGGNYTYFGNVVIPNGITIFKWNGSWTNHILFAGDGGVFDITAYHNNTKYTDLTAALGTYGANVPQYLRMGGMSVKFVQSSDNKYVQYRLMNQSFSTYIEDWVAVGSEIANEVDRHFIKSTNVCSGVVEYAGKVINSSGVLVDNATYNTSTIFPIKGNTQYTISNITFLVYYNEQKEFISRPNIENSTITTPTSARYARISSTKNPSLWQLNEGDTLLTYEKPDALISINVTIPTDDTFTQKGIAADSQAIGIKKSVIPFSIMAASNIVANLNVGEYGFNTMSNDIYFKIKAGGVTQNLHYIVLEKSVNTIYMYGGTRYKWIGNAMVPVMENSSVIKFNNSLEQFVLKAGVKYTIFNNNAFIITLNATNDNKDLVPIGTFTPYSEIEFTPSVDFDYIRCSQSNNPEIWIMTSYAVQQKKLIDSLFRGVDSTIFRIGGTKKTAPSLTIPLCNGISAKRFNISLIFDSPTRFSLTGVDALGNTIVLKSYLGENPTESKHTISYDKELPIESVNLYTASTESSKNVAYTIDILPLSVDNLPVKKTLMMSKRTSLVAGPSNAIELHCNGKQGNIYHVIIRASEATNKVIAIGYILPDGSHTSSKYQINNTSGIIEKVFKATMDFIGIWIWGASSTPTISVIMSIEQLIADEFHNSLTYQFGLGIDCKYETPTQTALTTETCAYFYGLYDALVSAYPGYVEKIDCDAKMVNDYGLTIPSELEGLPIYMYRFIPAYTPNSDALNTSITDKNRLKVMIVTGTHPEYMSIYDCYLTMKQICKEWANNDNIDALRWEAEYYILPCSGPWGIEHHTRGNYNYVDLNRNAPSHDWSYIADTHTTDPNTNQYSGASPNSEYETKLMVNMFNEIKPNIFIDHHNFTRGSHEIYITSKTAKGVENGATHISVMSRRWKKRYSTVFPQTDFIFGFCQYTREPGTRSNFACDNGCLGFTYESSNYCGWVNGEYDATQGQRNTAFVSTIATDGFLNFLLRVLKNYGRS